MKKFQIFLPLKFFPTFKEKLKSTFLEVFVIHSIPLITIARGPAFLIVISEYRYRRKSLYTVIVAGTVKFYYYTRNIVINVIVISGVE